MEDYKVKIEVTEKGRIDKTIQELSDFSRADAQKLIEGHAVFVKDIAVRKANFTVRPGDVIYITQVIQKEINAIAQDIPIDVVYEDDDLVIVNKASGMVVHPAPGNYDGTLVNALLHRFKDLSDINGQVRPGIVHRIDKQTSGLLVVAKNNDAHRFLAEQLKDHKISRIYYALVEGRLENEITHLDLPIGRDPKHRQRMTVTRINSKEAKTHVFVERIFDDKTLVRCELETGRTHQIRVHLKYIKHPVLGDPLYGTMLDDYGQRLHAAKLKLIHPTTKEEMEFEAPLPKEFDIKEK